MNNRKRKTLVFFICVVLALSGAAMMRASKADRPWSLLSPLLTVNAETAELKSGSFGDSGIWEFNPSTGVLTLRSEEPLVWSGSLSNQSFSNLLAETKTLEFGDGITGISGSVLRNSGFTYPNLVKIHFGKDVETIGINPFYGCYYLQSFTVDPSNQNYCSIDGIVYSKDKTTLVMCPSGLFRNQRTLAYYYTGYYSYSYGELEYYANGALTVPSGTVTIADYAFSNCRYLAYVYFPNTLKSIGTSAFECCYGMKWVRIPDSVTSLGSSAFSACDSIKSATIGNGIRAIPSYAFSQCYLLDTIVIGDSVEEIGYHAFYNCQPITITLPASLKTIQSGAFDRCDYHFESITYKGKMRDWKTINIESNNQIITSAVDYSLYNGENTARWIYTEKDYSIKYYSDGKLIIEIPWDEGETIVFNRELKKTGHYISNWEWNTDDGLAPETMPPKDLTATAIWSPVTYTVNYHANGGIGEMEPTVHTYGVAAGLPANTFTREGYVFLGWNTLENSSTVKYSDRQRVSNLSTTNGAQIHLYAVWTLEKKTVSFDANGGSCATQQKEVYHASAYGELPVPARSGYTFSGWFTTKTGGSKVTSSTQVTAAGDHTLFAHWAANSYTVSFNANGGTSPQSSKTVIFDKLYGDLPLPTREGYLFDGWFTEASGGNRVTSELTVIIPDNHTLYAHWVKIAVSSIAINKKPEQTSYYTGDTLKTAGLSLTVSYNDGKTETISSGFTCTPTILANAGTQSITVSYGGKTASFNVTVAADTVKSIAVSSPPAKNNYYVNEALDVTGLTLTIRFVSGRSKTVSDGFACTPSIFTTAGTQTVTVKFEGKTTTFNVSVAPDAVRSIAVQSPPDKTDYYVGDSLNAAGLTLSLLYYSGKEEIVSSGFSCAPTQLNNAGTQKITVSCNGKTAFFNVTVITDSVKSLALQSEPYLKNYYTGESLDTTGLALKATFQSGKTIIIKDGFTCAPTLLTSAGSQKITVTYGGKTAFFTVNVMQDTAIALSVRTNPTKTTYYVHDTLNTAGLTLTATYKSGKKEIVRSGFLCDPTVLQTVGKNLITVSWGNLKTSFSVTVLPLSYKLCFMVDGKIYHTEVCTAGAQIPLPQAPEKNGFLFNGWEPTLPETMPEHDVTVAAVFEPMSFDAVFIADGIRVKTVSYRTGETVIAEPSVPEKAGYTGEWESYTLAIGGVSVRAIYHPIPYLATFIADGNVVDTVEYTIETTSVASPPVPEKEGYSGKWESYSLALGGVTIHAIYTKNPTIAIRNYTRRTVDYKSTVIFTAITENAPADAVIRWFVDGKDAGTGETFKIEKATASYTVQCKLMRGNTVLAESEAETVKVKTDFFSRLIAFFRQLFGTLPVITQAMKETL